MSFRRFGNKITQLQAILGGHGHEVYSVPNLRIAIHHNTGCRHFFLIQPDDQVYPCPHFKGEHGLDIAATQANIIPALRLGGAVTLAPHLGEEQVNLFLACLGRLSAGWTGLPDRPEATPENCLRALWLAAHGQPRVLEEAASQPLPNLPSVGIEKLNELVNQLMSGVPLAYCTGRWRFMGLDFLATADALIPQRETEILGNSALKLLDQLVRERGQATVLDLCTGSGNLAVALAFRAPTCRVFGADLSEAAISLARKNAVHLNVQDRVEFQVGDLFAPFEGVAGSVKFDLITCNPPYISSAKVGAMRTEVASSGPRMAFDGGPFGLSILSRVIKESPRFLDPSSWVAFEVGVGQGPGMERLMKKMPEYSEVQAVPDSEGVIRVLSGRTRG